MRHTREGSEKEDSFDSPRVCLALHLPTPVVRAALKYAGTRNALVLIRVLIDTKFSDLSVVIICHNAMNSSSLSYGNSSAVVGTVQHLFVP